MVLQFSTAAARTAFLTRLEAKAPELSRHLKPSYSQPNVLTVRLSGDVSESSVRSGLEPYLDSSVEVFEDVQFQPLLQQA